MKKIKIKENCKPGPSTAASAHRSANSLGKQVLIKKRIRPAIKCLCPLFYLHTASLSAAMSCLETRQWILLIFHFTIMRKRWQEAAFICRSCQTAKLPRLTEALYSDCRRETLNAQPPLWGEIQSIILYHFTFQINRVLLLLLLLLLNWQKWMPNYPEFLIRTSMTQMCLCVVLLRDWNSSNRSHGIHSRREWMRNKSKNKTKNNKDKLIIFHLNIWDNVFLFFLILILYNPLSELETNK